jgi:O-methyltransferase involved in polyketide biosynthesis
MVFSSKILVSNQPNSEKISPPLSGVPETLLIPLHIRAQESLRTDALLKDDKAVEIVQKLDADFTNFKL